MAGARRSGLANWGSSGISGTVEVSRAADTTDTALKPLTRSSAVGAPRTEEHLVFVQLPREASNSQGSLPTHFTNSNHHWGAELSCARSPSAVSGQCQWFQRPC